MKEKSHDAKEGKTPPGMDMGMMKAMVMDSEMAVVKGHGLISNVPAQLDSMIDQVRSSSKGGAAFEAQKAFGAGRQGYFDYDIIGLLKVMMGPMSKNPATQPMMESLGRVKSTEPMVFALTFGEGRAQLQMNIPLAPFAQMVPRDR